MQELIGKVTSRLTWNPSGSLVCDVFRQPNVLTRPPHVSSATIFEISQYNFIKETTHKVSENSSTVHDQSRPST
ncbi:hypothetical protein T265_08141 [Opisthorchis viverrini]|uniref:Uncharacterized protein n=1 Tax=Opisthorchis viverrini TaxID=6198 RepID=A0A075A9J7_OPIVI|nr:hypothetical protein T265_08141 [Opisthorchis viverrini]KER24159.1 hypothetical protein T265_08141 [Opisthorchis viverrini]